MYCSSATVHPPSSVKLKRAQAGCKNAQHEISHWVYQQGLQYFESKVSRESLLSREEAQDLAGESLLEFERALLRIRDHTRYARRMFRNNLVRYLSRKRARRSKECLGEDQLPDGQFGDVAGEPRTVGSDGLSDRDSFRLAYVRQMLKEADPMTKAVWSYRLADEPLGYRQIGEILSMDEAALRMRVARFSKRIRKHVFKVERRHLKGTT